MLVYPIKSDIDAEHPDYGPIVALAVSHNRRTGLIPSHSPKSRDSAEDDVFFIATASQKRLVIWEAQEVNTQIDPERIGTHTTWEDLRDFSTKVSLATLSIST